MVAPETPLKFVPPAASARWVRVGTARWLMETDFRSLAGVWSAVTPQIGAVGVDGGLHLHRAVLGLHGRAGDIGRWCPSRSVWPAPWWWSSGTAPRAGRRRAVVGAGATVVGVVAPVDREARPVGADGGVGGAPGMVEGDEQPAGGTEDHHGGHQAAGQRGGPRVRRAARGRRGTGGGRRSRGHHQDRSKWMREDGTPAAFRPGREAAISRSGPQTKAWRSARSGMAERRLAALNGSPTARAAEGADQGEDPAASLLGQGTDLVEVDELGGGAGPEEHDRGVAGARAAGAGEALEQGTGRRHPHPADDQHQPVVGHELVGAQGAVGPFDGHPGAEGQPGDGPGGVTSVLHREA